jgi:glycosyltransferase involved in cell wall biosynthesis
MNTDTLASPQAPVRSPAPASRDPFPATSSSSRPQVDGKFLKVDGKRFWIKGVTYGSFSPNDEGEPYPAFHRLKDDFARMADAGINTVRLYNAPTPRIADAAWKAGLRLIPEVGWGPRFCELGTDREDFLYQWAKDRTCELAGHPAVLMYSIGNEVPPLVVRWYGVERVSQFLRRLCNIVKEHSDGGLVTYVNHPPTEYLNLPNFDVVSYNIYLENERTFRSYLARLHSLAGERPLFLAELGLDSAKNGRDAQAAFLHQYLRATFEKGLCGTAVYSWTDEWSIFDEAIEGWAFGITDSERHPKPALEVVSETYRLDHYQMSQRQWPRVTVVVATYNGSRTLATCLESLGRLNYPNYEVLVVDDGSTQPIDEIASRYPVHYHRIQPNGGLSNARNTGMKLASGKIVDYIDDDTFADPDWLFFMVQSLLEQGASAVGGPNLSPPDEKFTAQCVHHSPGNPTHVLLGDEIAEHVPGCNMAYVKNDLEGIGGFDVTHRAAGDDVDVCWKLLVREKKIAFSPSAIVWHRRRSSVLAYLKQQRGYGYAEAHLHEAYPSRFNVLGHSVWKGNIYDGLAAASFRPLPAIFRPRIYQGFFGSAMFQSMYQPPVSSWLTLFKSIEWQMLFLCVFFSGALGILAGSVVGWLLLLGMTGLAMTGFAAVYTGLEASHLRADQWTFWERIKGSLLIALLHLAQPWARFRGRIKGALQLWPARRRYPEDQRLWGNIDQRDRWLRLLDKHLRGCGWRCDPSGEWETSDLVIRGPGFYEVRLISVYEEVLHRGFHWVRFRLEGKRRPSLYVGAALVALGIVLIALAPSLLPLALPLAAFAILLLRSRRHTINAISQAALECGIALEMPEVDPQYEV